MTFGDLRQLVQFKRKHHAHTIRCKLSSSTTQLYPPHVSSLAAILPNHSWSVSMEQCAAATSDVAELAACEHCAGVPDRDLEACLFSAGTPATFSFS
mmetsp:Transcript_78799/g.211604  ORF Transcript_78799/g.211604 Transcript_78799/m.211604 type:complete len:97 (+) Transcript_78799:115-405(+)